MTCCKVQLHLTVCYHHVTYEFQSESTLYSCLNFKGFLARNRHNIWSLSDSNRIRTHNHLVRKLNDLAKLAKWWSCVVSTYLYGAFYSVLFSCQIQVSEWTCTLEIPECQRTLCSKQVWYLKFKWQEWDLNPQPLSL